jgi:hypothetical protein
MAGALVVLLALSGGCVVVEPEPPEPVRVVLVNSTEYDVRPNLYTSGSATSATALFVSGNLRTDFTDRAFPELRAGETRTLTLECDDVQSVGSDAPVLFDAAQVIATASEDRAFVAKGADFDCGAVLTFTFFTEGDVFRVSGEVE